MSQPADIDKNVRQTARLLVRLRGCVRKWAFEHMQTAKFLARLRGCLPEALLLAYVIRPTFS